MVENKVLNKSRKLHGKMYLNDKKQLELNIYCLSPRIYQLQNFLYLPKSRILRRVTNSKIILFIIKKIESYLHSMFQASRLECLKSKRSTISVHLSLHPLASDSKSLLPICH